ncbi:MAG TPA: aldehyde dehydrogenase family protein, partial [Porticoccaceae bacterium]|nr:aldehyde dehydrogenase family protein [Porticoccaceae bacterium]
STVDVGPVVSRAACERILAMVEKAKASGECRLVTRGERVGGEFAEGFYVSPMVFADVKPDSELAQQEIFGPVLCITPFDTEDEALAIANATEYGLAAYIQTRNLSRALRLSTELRAGTVCINGAMQIQPESPFGGERLSGHGREGGREGLEEFLRTKTVSITACDG